MSANEHSSEVCPRHHRRWSSCRSAKCRMDAEVVVRVHDKHHEVYAGEVLDSQVTLVYRGPRPDLLDPKIVSCGRRAEPVAGGAPGAPEPDRLASAGVNA